MKWAVVRVAAGIVTILVLLFASKLAAGADLADEPHEPAESPASIAAVGKAVSTASETFFGIETAKHWYAQQFERDGVVRSAINWHDKVLDAFAKRAVAEAVKPAVDVARGVVDPASVKVPANAMYVRFSKSFLRSYFSKRFEKKLPVRDTILGAAVRGNSHTVANTELELIDNPKEAQAKLFFKGTTSFSTTSSSGPIQVNSQGATNFTSQKRVWFDGLNVLQSKPTTEANTNSTITGINTSLPGLRGRISLRIANDEVAAKREQARQITTEKSKRQIEAAFEKVARERAAMFTEELREQYAKLPLEGKFALSEIRCSTTPDALQIVVIGRGENEPTFAEEPARIKNQPDIEVHIHSALLQKIVVSKELRQTLQLAVFRMVERPLLSAVTATAKKPNQVVAAKPVVAQPEREMQLHWTEGEDLPWLSLVWYAKAVKSDTPMQPTPARVTTTPQGNRR
jgi:hypothetical protein